MNCISSRVFPDNSLWEGIAQERKWHLTQAASYFYKAGMSTESKHYYCFLGSFHMLLSLPYRIPFLNCLAYVVNHLMLAIFYPTYVQNSQREALNNGNLEGAYLMYQRGASVFNTNYLGETLIDLYLKKQDFSLYPRIYDLLLKGCPFNIQNKNMEVVLQKAAEDNQKEVVLHLLERGIQIPSWTLKAIITSPPISPPTPSVVPSELAPFIKETSKPCVGRFKQKCEINRIFYQRYNNRPLLIGPNGIGKTALANGCSEKRVVSVHLSLLRNASEEQIGHLRHFITLHREDTIFFIDNLDKSSLNFLEQFLPLFENVTCIGCALVDDDLSKYFTVVELEELSDQEIIEVGLSIFPYIEEETIRVAIEYCRRHVPNQALPQALLNVLDCAQAAIQTQQEYGSLKGQKGELVIEQEKKERELYKWEGKLKFLNHFEVEASSKIRKEAEEQEARLQKEIGIERVFFSTVTPQLIPYLFKSSPLIDDIEGFLKNRVFGQDHVIEKVIPAIYNAAHGFTSLNRAQGAFHFVGLTGTGKTEMAKAIADYLGINFVHVDMTKYRDAHNDSTLVGTSAGYVGYEQGGLIQKEAKRGPMVLLLDEADKADPCVLSNLLLHLLEEGEMLDPLLRTKIKMHRVFVILASNLGSRRILNAMSLKRPIFCCRRTQMKRLDHKSIAKLIQPDLELFARHRYELIARLQTIPFIPIENPSVINEITIKLLEKEKCFAYKEFKVILQWTDAFINSFIPFVQPKLGVRPIRNYLENELRFKIGKACINKKNSILKLDYDKEVILLG